MTYTQTALFCAIFIGTIAREIIQKPVARKYPPQVFPAFCALFLLLVCILSLPWTKGFLTSPQIPLQKQPLTILAAVVKAPLIWLLLRMGIEIRSKSSSSAIYVMPIGLAFIALTNFLIFGTSLSSIQWASVVTLGLLGIGYACTGHLSELDKRMKVIFAGCVGLLPILGGIDHFVISNTNWFCHLFGYAIVLAILSPFMLPSTYRFTELFKDSRLLAAGLGFAVVEMIVIGSMVQYLPVSIVLVAVTMAVPVIMLMASWLWEESTPGKQLAFGMLSFIVGLGVFF